MKELFFAVSLFFGLINSMFSQCWKSISGGGFDGVNFALVIKDDGSLWKLNNSNYPTMHMMPIGSDINWASIFAGNQNAYALKTDSTLWEIIGGLYYFDFGTLNSNQIGTDSDWVQITDGFAIKSNGTLWNIVQGVQVGVDSNWKYVTSTNSWNPHIHAIKTDGTLWAWGRNNKGQLGDGTTTNRDSPVQIGLDSNWTVVTGGEWNSFGIRADGTLWAWGWNDEGQLGDGTTVNRLSPAQIGNDSNWTSVVSKYHHTLALKDDSTLWMWGGIHFANNAFHTPTLLNGNENWLQIATGGENLTLALNSESEIWNFSWNPEPSELVDCNSLFLMDKQLNDYYRIYPNPFTESITVEITPEINLGDKKIIISNILGEIVYSSEMEKNLEHIALPFLNKGIYFLSIQSQDGNKFIYNVVLN